MPIPFEFIHAADLHLGCPFQGLRQTAPDIAAVLHEATYKAFDNIVAYAIAQKVDFVVFAGDIYNRNENSLQPQLRFRDGLHRLHAAGIGSCVIHGNHDPHDGSTAGLAWPDTCHRFPAAPSEPCIMRKNGEEIAVVAGISYGKRDVTDNLSRRYKHDHQHLFSIGVLHTNCGSNPEHGAYAPSSVEELKTFHFDYWALGHIHIHGKLHAEHPAIIYAGTPQGLNPKETGEHGFYHVRVDANRRLQADFVTACAVVWHAEELDAAAWNSEDDAVTALQELADELPVRFGGRSVLVRITISGRSGLHKWLNDGSNQRDLLDRLRASAGRDPFVWVDRIRVDTRPPIDMEKLELADDVLGEVLRQARYARSTEEGKLSARAQLDDLFSHHRAKKLLAEPSPEHLERLIERASVMVADRLAEEEAGS